MNKEEKREKGTRHYVSLIYESREAFCHLILKVWRAQPTKFCLVKIGYIFKFIAPWPRVNINKKLETFSIFKISKIVWKPSKNRKTTFISLGLQGSSMQSKIENRFLRIGRTPRLECLNLLVQTTMGLASDSTCATSWSGTKFDKIQDPGFLSSGKACLVTTTSPIPSRPILNI